MHCVCHRKKPGYKKGHAHRIFPNLLNQNFEVDKPNKVWCTDFTYLYLSNGNVRYNCTIIDLYDRSVVASENDRWISTDLAIRTLEKVISLTGVKPGEVILHSDQGSQFTSYEFTRYCKDVGIQQSMSNAGCPYDNAATERYYNTLKSELIYQYSFDTTGEMDYAVSEFAYNWYNQVRPHAHNGYKTPFEKRYAFG